MELSLLDYVVLVTSAEKDLILLLLRSDVNLLQILIAMEILTTQPLVIGKIQCVTRVSAPKVTTVLKELLFPKSVLLVNSQNLGE